MNHPIVSIIIPTYNRADLIVETLDSVKNQTYKHWECIIVDDGSTDATENIVLNFINSDSRFQYHKRPENHKPGGNGARNYGFLLSKGTFINWLDSDDIISENKLDSQINGIKNLPKAVSTCRWKRFTKSIDDNDFDRSYSFFKNYDDPKLIFNDFAISKSFLPQHCYLVSRDIIQISGLWNEDLMINQDGEFYTRVLLNSKNIIFSCLPIVYYRTSQNSVSSYNSFQKANNAIISWQLIEAYLNLSGLQNTLYVENAKDYIFLRANKDYNILLKRYKSFFKKQFYRNSLFYKICKKINIK